MPQGVVKKDSEDWRRMWASASFVGVLIIIGLPLWWKTTEVYRVSLPYEDISKLGSISLTARAELTVLANDDATAKEVAGLIEKAFQDYDVIDLKVTASVLPSHLHQTLDSVADEVEAVEEIGSTLDLMKTNHMYVVQRTPLYQQVWLGQERVMLFRDATSATTLVEALRDWVYQPSVLNGARSEIADTSRQTRFPPADGYHIVLSVVHPRPDAMDVSFDAGEAMEDYIGSFVDELSELHNFTLKSQWLHFLDFDFQAKQIADSSEWGRHFAVRTERLQLVVSRLEERAATHVSARATINLVLYVVPCHMAPLALYDDNDKPLLSPVQAFMSPKWGGVMFGSPIPSSCSTPSNYEPPVRQVMGTFLSQLRKLLGIHDKAPIENAHLIPLRSVSPRRWEIDQLLRLRSLEQLHSAANTLMSLKQLLGEIPNIVINDDVGDSINLAVLSIHKSTSLMRSGDLVEAYKTSQRAFLAAETAFMEPSLLALLYFPDDQKYAIYIPLFLPITVPVLLSFKNLIQWMRGNKTEKLKTA